MNKSERKLSAKDAVDLRELYQSGDFRMIDLAEMFGVSVRTINKIIKGEGYADVTGGKPVKLPNGMKRIYTKGQDGFHILTNEQVMKIRQDYIKLRMKGNQATAIFDAFANKYNVSPHTINAVIYNYTWKHLPSVTELRKEMRQ